MKKITIYNGIRFTFSLQMNTVIERSIDGNRFHTLTVTSDNYHRNYQINDRLIADDVEQAETDAKDFAEGKKVVDPSVIAFQALGFE